jgi:hypothetical protein
VTLEISRNKCKIDVTPGTLTATDTCIGYHVTRFEVSRNVILHMRYVSVCVGVGNDTHSSNTCDMYVSDLRHIHDPVLSSLKIEGILSFFFFFFFFFLAVSRFIRQFTHKL